MRTPRYTDMHRYPNGYRKSTNTYVAATFRRVKAEQQKDTEERRVKVAPLKRSGSK